MKEGFFHIADIKAYDHILFIAALVAIYHYKQWKSLIGLITAFTIGHSLALGLATFQLIKIDTNLVEFLIPVTIVITSLWNLYLTNKTKMFHVEHNKQTYLIIIFFGLIHGLGFSNYLRFMLTREETITMPLLLFNLGLEFGQILILFVLLFLNFVSLKIISLRQKTWARIISILVLLISIPILIERTQSLF